MMQDDTQPTYLILFVTPAFVHLGDVPVFVGKRHPTHPHGDVTLNKTGSRF